MACTRGWLRDAAGWCVCPAAARLWRRGSSRPGVADEVRDERRPSGPFLRAQAFARVAVEELVQPARGTPVGLDVVDDSVANVLGEAWIDVNERLDQQVVD